MATESGEYAAVRVRGRWVEVNDLPAGFWRWPDAAQVVCLGVRFPGWEEACNGRSGLAAKVLVGSGLVQC